MAKRILNRKELRNDYDAATRRPQVEEEGADEEETEADEGDAEEEAQAEDEAEEEPVKEAPKKRKKAAPKKPAAKSRSRAAKHVRLRVVWGVFNNSNQCIATYEYPKRHEAEEHAARLTADKKSPHFLQPVKEPMP